MDLEKLPRSLPSVPWAPALVCPGWGRGVVPSSALGAPVHTSTAVPNWALCLQRAHEGHAHPLKDPPQSPTCRIQCLLFATRTDALVALQSLLHLTPVPAPHVTVVKSKQQGVSSTDLSCFVQLGREVSALLSDC